MTDRKLLREQWRTVASALGIEIVEPFYLRSASGEQYEFAVLLPQFGSERGMLIDVEHNPDAFAIATSAGFGCSSMLAETFHLPVDPESYIECLVDWGWSVDGQSPPAWYSNAA
jgi:hypothetical protein